MITTNRTHKVASMMAIMMVTFTVGYGQGMLLEGASKLFRSVMQKEANTEFTTFNANLITVAEEEKDSFRINAVLNLFDINRQDEAHNTVIASFSVKNIDVAYEAELETESWMETPFSEQIETVPAVEDWMTTSFASEIEAAPSVEDWMTTSFSNNLEGAVEVESWMTAPLAEQFEGAIVTEEWMTTPLTANIENEVATENWMTQPLYENQSMEQSLDTEAWMTQPLYAASESAIALENWMTQLLR